MAVLPDVLEHGLRVVFCGTAVGEASARVGAYYAGPGNQFWSVLWRVGLTPRRLAPSEFRELPLHGIGLSDLVKARAGGDAVLSADDFYTQSLTDKIRQFAPMILAFNGKKAAETFLGRAVSYGLQDEKIGQTILFVLPSTSGAARGYWDESHWEALAAQVKGPA